MNKFQIILAEFKNPHDLLTAAKKGYTQLGKFYGLTSGFFGR